MNGFKQDLLSQYQLGKPDVLERNSIMAKYKVTLTRDERFLLCRTVRGHLFGADIRLFRTLAAS